MADSVLYRHRFSDNDADLDHVEEIAFEQPVYLTGFEVGELSGEGRLRVYAKDALCLSSGRFVPLFDGILSAHEQRFELPKTVSDYVLLRGSFAVLEFSLMGRNYVHSIDPIASIGMETCQIQLKNDPRVFQNALENLPFVHGFPSNLRSVIHKLGKGEDLDDHASTSIFTAANRVCSLLGISQTDVPQPISEPVEDIDAEDAFFCAKAVLENLRGLESDGHRNRRMEMIRLGMRSLAMTCLLCSCRSTALHFLSNGGAMALTNIFKLRGLTALMTRYLVCTAELITLTAGPIGCEALLGMWNTIGNVVTNQDEDSNILHVPGIVNAKLSKEKTQRMELTLSTLPPGMIVSGKKSLDNDTKSDSKPDSEVHTNPSRRHRERHEDRDLSRKRSSAKRKEKKKNKKHRSSERSSDIHDSRRHREDKDIKKHHRHRVRSEKRKKSRSKEKHSNGENAKIRESPVPETLTDPKDKNAEGPLVKRQKRDLSIENHSKCLDLRTKGSSSLRCVSLYDRFVDILIQPRPEGIVRSVKRLLDRLNFYKCLLDFHATTYEIIAFLKAHHKSELSLSFSDISGVFSIIAKCLRRIMTFMKDSMQNTIDWETDDTKEHRQGLWTSHSSDFDVCFLEYMSCIDFFGSLKLIVQAISLSSKEWETSEPIVKEFANDILCHAASLILFLVKSSNGLNFLKAIAKTLSEMKQIQENMFDPNGFTLQNGSHLFQKKLSFVLLVLECSRNMKSIENDKSNIKEATRAYEYVFKIVTDLRKRDAFLYALQLHRGFVAKLCALFCSSNTNTASNPSLLIPNHTVPSVVPFVFELCEMSSIPSMFQELIEGWDVLHKTIEIEKQGETEMVSQIDPQTYLDELLGMLEACKRRSDENVFVSLKELPSLLPRFISKGEDGKKRGALDESDVAAFFRDRKRVGKTLMYLNALSCTMVSDMDAIRVSSLYGLNLMNTLECALMTANQLFGMANVDTLCAVMTGDFKNDLYLSKRTCRATRFFCCVVHALSTVLKRLYASDIAVKSTRCVESLLKAYSYLCVTPEYMNVILGHRSDCCEVLKAKNAVVDALLLWIHADWLPSVLDFVFSNTKPFNHLARPMHIFTKSCLIGDMIQDEWPPLATEMRKKGFVETPSNVKIRIALAKGLEMHPLALSYLIEFSLGSESHIVRCVMTRLCARAAGLGGGMAPFLIKPIVTELASLVKNGSSSSDAYRMAEVLNALLPWPAIKAAFLDAKLMSSVSRFIHELATECPKDENLLAICDSFLDVFGILMNPEICLDPFELERSRFQSDCPNASEIVSMVAALLANLQHFPGFEQKILHLLESISRMPSGNLSILRGISRWRSAHVAQDITSDISFEVLIAWALQKLKCDSSPVKFDFLAQFLKNLPSTGLQEDNQDFDHIPFPVRFKSILSRTQEAHVPETGFSDGKAENSVGIFWKFVHAFPPNPLKKNWAKWKCLGSDSVSPCQYYLSGHSLTPSSRSRDVMFHTPISQPSNEQSEGGSISTSKDVRPHSDLPPVVVLPRRGMEHRRNKTTLGSSRPPSIHVDDYNKNDDETAPEKSKSEANNSMGGETEAKMEGMGWIQGLKEIPARFSDQTSSLQMETSLPASDPNDKETLTSGLVSVSEAVVDIPGIGSVHQSSMLQGKTSSMGSSFGNPSRSSVEDGFLRNPRGLPKRVTK